MEGRRKREVFLPLRTSRGGWEYLFDLLDPTLEREVLLERVLYIACELTSARGGCLLLWNPRREEVKVCSSRGEDPSPVGDLEGLAIKVTAHRKGLTVSSNCSEGCLSRALVAVPLFIKDQPFGVICVWRKKDRGSFPALDLFRLEAFSRWASLCIENNALYDTVYRNIMDTFQSLVITLEAKDPYTKEHSQRATQIALDVAEVMGATEAERESLRIAGWLHDIGKIGIQDSILSKPGPLTAEEYEVIKTHPLIGEKILEPLGLLPLERKIIRNHHERWDGKGYPDGLRGEEIPLLVRIFTAADAFEAMTSDRPYRRAKTVEEALRELEVLSGAQFDAEVVEALREIVRRKGWKERGEKG